MFALFAFGYIFGFVGLLLAVPMAAAAGVLCRFALNAVSRHRSFILELEPEPPVLLPPPSLAAGEANDDKGAPACAGPAAPQPSAATISW